MLSVYQISHCVYCIVHWLWFRLNGRHELLLKVGKNLITFWVWGERFRLSTQSLLADLIILAYKTKKCIVYLLFIQTVHRYIPSSVASINLFFSFLKNRHGNCRTTRCYAQLSLGLFLFVLQSLWAYQFRYCYLLDYV